MAQLLQHQDSSVLYAKYHASCKWRWLQFLDFHQRGPSGKLLAGSSSSHADGGGHKDANSYVPLNSTKHDRLLKEAKPSKSLILNRDAKKTKSGKALIRALLSKTLFGKYYRKKKMLPLTPQLLRTLSIHHLECNDYVLQDEVSSDSETSQADSTEEGAYPLENSDKVSLLSRRRNSEAYRRSESVSRAGNHSTLKQKMHGGRLHESVTNDFVRMLDLIHVRREMLVKNLEDSKFISKNDSTDQHTSKSDRVLNKSGSFPVIDKSSRRNAHPSKSQQKVLSKNFVDQGHTSSVQAYALNSTKTSNDTQSVSSKVQVDTLKSEALYASDGSPTVHIKDPKERLKDLSTENRKEHQRISKDAFMHKIPYGKSVVDDLATPKLFRSSSARSHRDSSKENTGMSSRDNSYKGMQRSRSLTESLGRYSSLLENLSTKNSKGLQVNLLLTQDDQTETIHDTPLLIEKRSPLDDDEGHATHYPVDGESVDSLVEKQCLDVDNGEILDADIQPPTHDALEQSTLCKVSDSAQDQSTDTHMPPKVNELEEELLLHNIELEKDLKLDQLENEHAASSEQDLGFEARPEHLYNVTDSKIESEAFDEPDVNISNELEASILNLGAEHKSEGLKSSNAHRDTQVDQKDESEFLVHFSNLTTEKRIDQIPFKCVKNLLLKSDFNGLELFSVLNGELGGHLDELEVDSNDSDEVPLEQQVLLDMMNEELLELYEKSSAHGWMPRFSSQLRALPAGDTLLEEVWEKISLQLGDQVQTFSTYVDIIAQDLAKNRWLSLLMDAESVGMEMESLILDEMIDELALELVES